MPYKCLPYGVCYNHESYCSSSSRTVEPCFPSELLDSEAELFSWCRQFVKGEIHTLPDQSCLFACFHRFNATDLFDFQQNGLKITRLQTEVVIMISVLVNWMVCGTILLVLITYCKAYRSNSIIARQVKFWKLHSRKRGHVTRINNRKAEEDSYTEAGEEIALQPISSWESTTTDKLTPVQQHTRKAHESPEHTIDKLQVVMDEYDIDMKRLPSLELQKRHRDAERGLTFQTTPSFPSTSGRYDDSGNGRNLLDDVDLSMVISPRIDVMEEHAV